MNIKINNTTATLAEFKNNIPKPSDGTQQLNILSAEAQVIITVSDKMKTEMGLDNNILKSEPRRYYPMGFGHQNMTETKEVYICKNSSMVSIEDAKNYCAALISLVTNKILIVKLIDKKFENKIYYIISENFNDSDYLAIPAVITADSAAGMSFVTAEDKKALGIEFDDGITI